jgi:hypothetical protein
LPESSSTAKASAVPHHRIRNSVFNDEADHVGCVKSHPANAVRLQMWGWFAKHNPTHHNTLQHPFNDMPCSAHRTHPARSASRPGLPPPACSGAPVPRCLCCRSGLRPGQAASSGSRWLQGRQQTARTLCWARAAATGQQRICLDVSACSMHLCRSACRKGLCE